MSRTISAPRMGKRLLALLLSAGVGLGLLPQTAFAAQTGSSGTDRTVFDALGFSTGAPEGYEQEEGITDTPFGKTYATLSEVKELFAVNTNDNHKDGKDDRDPAKSAAYLYGHNKATGGSISDFFMGSSKTDSALSGDAMLTAEGNFSADNDGRKKNVAVLSYQTTSEGKDAVRMRAGDADSREFSGGLNGSSGTKWLLYGSGFGNADDKDSSNHFSLSAPYLPYNYLDLAVGDFDGDGIDEIAYYAGVSTPVVDVWKLQKTDGNSYMESKNWKRAWRYNLPKTDGLIPNMVSLAAADIDKDGIDDLAISYGYYKYKGAAQASKAVVLMGADNSQMMTRSYDIPLENVYRAGLTAGDIDNDGRNELIVGGSADTKNRDKRYLAIYGWNGKGFNRLAAQNVNPTDGTWPNLTHNYDKYYTSLPYMVANMTTGKFYGLGDGSCIYMDSIILRYGSGGIEVLDQVGMFANKFHLGYEPNNAINQAMFFVEWGAQAADLTGNGQETVGISRSPIQLDDGDAKLKDNNELFFADHNYFAHGYRDNQYLDILSLGGSGQSRTVTNVCSQWSGNSWKNDGDNHQSSDAVAFCLPNTDNNDTISLRYTGEHYYTYADPEVLAVLASPPYFADLANDDDDSQMIESSTSYSSSHGSGSGSGYSNSFSVGVYTSWEHTFSIFGVELFSAEAEASINNTFTWETQKSSSVEYEVSYATMAGMDSVVLYALPIETYIYEATMPDGTTQMMTVNLPYQPTVRTISAADYAEVQKVYSDILPDVTKMLTHTIGDPVSYAPSVSALPDGRTQTLVYDGSFVTVGQGSQNTTAQSISMTEETENSFSYDLDIETKAGVGVGGVTVGITAGYSHGAGSVHITTAGSTYSGELNGLPTQAERYGYSFDWKLVGCLYQGRYPFVTYLVNSVTAPPLLPENFGTNEDETTTDQIALEWDYPGNAAGFVIYRYLQSPSDSGYYKIGTVAGGDYISAEDGVKHYQFIDKGLSANTGYQYRIQTIGLSQPNESIPSEAYSTYTKPDSGVPQVGVSTERLATYPDTKSGVTAYIENSDEFTDSLIFHQWQKQTARGWEDVEGEKAASLTFQYPDMGVEGVYRCKVSAMVGQSLVTAYSPEVTVTFAQRASQIASLTIDGSTLTAVVKGSGAAVRPTGTVNFILTSANAETVYTAQLDETGTARVAISPAADLYKITATYSGSKIFLPASYEGEPLFYTNGVAPGSSYVDVKDSYVYGDALTFDKYTVNADGTFDKESFTPGKWDSIPDQSAADRFAAGRAGWIGKAKFTDGGKTYTVSIEPREVEVVGLTDYSFAENSGSAADMLDNVTIRGLAEDWAEDDGYVMTDKGYFLSLDLRFTNSAGESLGYNYPSTPGAYTVRIEKDSKAINDNYTLICPTARLTITGRTYPLSAAVADGQETYGTVSVTYPKDALTAAVGQTVVFAAVPKPGYEVKTWYTAGKDNALTEIADSAGKDTLTMTQTKDGLKVVVEFQKKNNTLTVSAQPDGAGKVTTEDKLFHNGHAYTADYEFIFTPEPTDGWHFTGWEYRVSGQTPRYSEDDSFTVKMPDSSVQLIARFERDTYKLTLGDHLTAYDENGNEIADLSAIPGDTKITVRPENGFHLSEGAEWTLEGAEKDDASTEDALVFVLTQDASVSVAVEAGKFSVALDMENVTGGTAAVSAAGELEAGTKVTFTASPARGYAFEGWKNGDAIVSTSAEYTVTVSGALTLTPSFAPQQGRKVTLGDKIAWTITRGGEAVEADEPTLYPGESITLTAQPRDGDMVESWTVNGAPAASTAKTLTYTYAELEDANDIAVAFKPVTYFTVHFGADIAATADGTSIADGDEVAAGSRMEFTYTGSGYVEQWKNGEDEIGGAVDPLVIDPLTDNLNITVTAGEREVFTVTDENSAPEHYTAVLTGAYEAAGGYVEGSDVVITVTPEDGWRITAVTCGEVQFTEENGVWTGKIEGIGENMTYAVTVEEITAPPAQKFTITFDPTDGTLSGGTTAETDENGRLSALPTPTRSGYTFGGWFTAAEGGERVSASRSYTEDTKLYAHWTKNTTPSTPSGGGSGGGGGGGGGISAPSTNPVTPSQPENGTVSADKKTAAKGDTVTITVTPDEGYQVDTITVTDKNGKTVAVKDLGNGRYRFTMPGSAVTITPTFVPVNGGDAKTFVDVAESAYYAKAVAWAVEHGVTDGTDADHFSPDAPCTRAQIVTFLWRAAGSPEPQSGSTFADVAESAYYAKAVAWAIQCGITNGTSADTFSPEAPCTRAQGITFLWRAQNSPAAGGAGRFADVDAGAYYAQAVAWATQHGVTNGTSKDAFSPDAPCTRAQIVTFLWKTLA